MAGRKRRERGGFSKQLREQITRTVSQKLREDPEQFAKLVEAGIVDPDTLAELTDTGDIRGMIGEFKAAMTKLASEDPSALEALDIRPLDVMPAPTVTEAL